MSRNKRYDEEAFGSDSFLDIVANMVGILIILVMIAGLRAKQAPEFDAQPTDEQRNALAELENEAGALAGEVRSRLAEVEQLAAIGRSRELERDSLLYLSAQAKHLLGEKRNTLGSRERDEFDLRRKVAERETMLTKLTRGLQDAAATEVTAVKIENYPTPISRTVHGHEAHFQLKHGRVVFVPIEDAQAAMISDIKRNMYKLESLSEVSDIVGPIGDYRLRYTVSKVAAGRGQVMLDLTYEMLPLADPLGETIEEAFAPNSEFREAMAKTNPRHTTITLWAYPDSFALYRTLKKELYNQGFAVAGRPLPMHQLISGSPHGTKSAAE
ncbi:MAG TPA: hypothetical protein VHZ24_16320 [Pirellulales bacterium]|jgi:hypothetical protein|nr:hypothetical protein [Pirellulales bacterium]